jgi:hypothetical protein
MNIIAALAAPDPGDHPWFRNRIFVLPTAATGLKPVHLTRIETPRWVGDFLNRVRMISIDADEPNTSAQR